MSLRSLLLTPREENLFKNTALDFQELGDQFSSLDQQHKTATVGMWVFLATEVMFFGALFVSVSVYWFTHTKPVESASVKLCWQIGATNTIVLLVSSLMMALAVHFAEHGDHKKVVRFLLLTAGFGVLFLCLKGLEYYIDFQDNLVPGLKFDEEEWLTKEGLARSEIGYVKIFLVLYWFMTGLHALHMIIGVTMVSIVSFLTHRGHFSAEHYTPIEVVGLYWHFVDIVWLFLFPGLYLMGTHHW